MSGIAFPGSFLFGTAIAGFQVDMGCPTLSAEACVDRNSDWYVFTTSPETVASERAHLSGQDPALVGPGFWELYADDIRRADEELHQNSLRLSIEWSRIFPTATDFATSFEELDQLADAESVSRYQAIFAELEARGIKPLVTLNHYTLPIWIHDAKGCHVDFANCSPKGWVDRERTVREIAKYAGYCARKFADSVDLWITINEPLQNVLFGYVQPGPARSHPPAVSLQTVAARGVFNTLIDAHARMYDAIKQADDADADADGSSSLIGVAYPLVPIEPLDLNAPLDVQAASNVDYLWNRAYLNAVVRGQWDEKLDGSSVVRADLTGRMDFVGVNWYFGLKVSGLEASLIPELSPKFTANPLSFSETPNQPEKLIEFLRFINQDLGVPALITENGFAVADDESAASHYLVRNLSAVGEALASGADVRGYFYWTLMDNYEWNHGMNIRMGLYGVDRDDPLRLRRPRHAAKTYAQIARQGLLSDNLRDVYASP